VQYQTRTKKKGHNLPLKKVQGHYAVIGKHGGKATVDKYLLPRLYVSLCLLKNDMGKVIFKNSQHSVLSK
jgi:hypothetical protein